MWRYTHVVCMWYACGGVHVEVCMWRYMHVEVCMWGGRVAGSVAEVEVGDQCQTHLSERRAQLGRLGRLVFRSALCLPQLQLDDALRFGQLEPGLALL